MTRFIYSFISFLIALFFVLLGIIGVLIPWSGGVRAEIVSMISGHSIAISLFGFTLIAIGIAVAVQIILASRSTYYQFTVRNNHVNVDESIIQSYLNKYWHDLFNQDVTCHVTLKGNKIHVTADIPHVAPEEQEELLTKIQQELGDLFGDILGYRQEFYLAINFAAETPKAERAPA
jgi:hypothetical protein